MKIKDWLSIREGALHLKPDKMVTFFVAWSNLFVANLQRNRTKLKPKMALMVDVATRISKAMADVTMAPSIFVCSQSTVRTQACTF